MPKSESGQEIKERESYSILSFHHIVSKGKVAQ